MGSRRMHKYVRIFLMTTPFLVPWLMIIVEEMYGKGAGWNPVLITIFFMSLTALYTCGIISSIRRNNKADIVYELLMFHIVKVPLFVVAWVAYMIVFIVMCFCINGFENIQ